MKLFRLYHLKSYPVNSVQFGREKNEMHYIWNPQDYLEQDGLMEPFSTATLVFAVFGFFLFSKKMNIQGIWHAYCMYGMSIVCTVGLAAMWRYLKQLRLR